MKVAVYTICKDEAGHVDRWLDCTRDADFRVVCDTGSTDGTRAAFRARGIHPFHLDINPFRFDDARNATLALVPGDVDVCISLDLDEVLEPGWREALERKWRRTARSTSGWIDFNFNGRIFRQNNRVHSRHGWRWKYPCHEGLYRNMQSVSIAIELEGFQITHLPDVTKPRPNYLEMLAWGDWEYPNDARMLHYYGRELMFHGHYHEALAKFDAYLHLPETFPQERQQTTKFMEHCLEALNPGEAERRFEALKTYGRL